MGHGLPGVAAVPADGHGSVPRLFLAAEDQHSPVVQFHRLGFVHGGNIAAAPPGDAVVIAEEQAGLAGLYTGTISRPFFRSSG